MKKINVQKYGDLEKIKYVYPKIFKIILNDQFYDSHVYIEQEKNFYEIKKWCEDCEISITENEINEFLKSVKSFDFDNITLKFFKTYASILKNKISKFFEIIDMIDTLCNDPLDARSLWELIKIKKLEQECEKYDLHVDIRGIYYEDIERIMVPLIDNILELQKIIRKANLRETYLMMSVTFENVEKGIYSYPIESLQINDLENDKIRGCIPLSENQKNILQSEKAIHNELVHSRKII